MRITSVLLLSIFFSYSLFSDQWFRSNALGMELDAVQTPLQNGWELQKINDNRILFQDGVEKKKWEIISEDTGSTERFYRDGQLFSVSVYDMNRRLQEEEFWNSGELERKRTYIYAQNNLIERSTYNASGELLLQDRIRLREDGTLLSLFRSNGGTFHQNWSPPAEAGGDWALHDQSGLLTLYNSKGLPEEIQQMEEGRLIKRELRYYNTRGQHVSSELYYPLRDEKVLREFNDREQLIQEQQYHKDILVSIISFRYTGSNLSEKILQGQGPEQRWKYYYSGDELLLEEYYQDDLLIRRKEYKASGPSME